MKIRYYGPVYDLITLKDPKFTQAVEVRLCLCLYKYILHIILDVCV